MNMIQTFTTEISAGLGDAVATRSTVALASVAFLAKGTPTEQEKVLRHPAKASVNDADLYGLESVLVSTGWNKNDDVFDPRECWAARQTPEDKRFDYEHDDADVIGHITSVRAINEDMEVLADDTKPEDLPAKFHLLTGAVLYRVWEKEDRQKRMDDILTEIAEGKWFVSMECLFAAFDYALLSPDGEMRIVTRNNDTAFLTKHLRAYGGNGTFNGERVGRLLRTILFTGKGLTRTPANGDSIIFPPPNQVARGSLERSVAAFLGEVDEASVAIRLAGLVLDVERFFGEAGPVLPC